MSEQLESLLNEAAAIAMYHPSKDARAFACAVSDYFAAAPKVEREGLTYRMLGTTDTICADDEFIDDNCIDWNRPVGWEVGMRWTYTFKTARRGIAPAHGERKEVG